MIVPNESPPIRSFRNSPTDAENKNDCFKNMDSDSSSPNSIKSSPPKLNLRETKNDDNFSPWIEITLKAGNVMHKRKTKKMENIDFQGLVKGSSSCGVYNQSSKKKVKSKLKKLNFNEAISGSSSFLS
jgi:hypothetical protein